jgi:CRISPR/Cas system-associated exonuclease Cas4 (RecB family)
MIQLRASEVVASLASFRISSAGLFQASETLDTRSRRSALRSQHEVTIVSKVKSVPKSATRNQLNCTNTSTRPTPVCQEASIDGRITGSSDLSVGS